MALQFIKLFQISSFEGNTESENDVSRRVMFSFIVFIALPIVYFFFIILDYKAYFQPIDRLHFDQFIVPIVIAMCVFCSWIVKLKYTVAGRVLFLFCWPLLLHIIPMWLQDAPLDYFVAFPMGLIFHAILIQLMLSQKQETWLHWIFLSINFASLCFAANIIAFFDTGADIPVKMMVQRYYFLDNLLYWLLFNLTTFYLLYSIGNYIGKINSAKNMIEKQKSDLEVLNAALELKVLERTKALEEQNKKLVNHAYYNAHILRGPFCRVKGLIELQSLLSEEEKVEIEVNEKIKICIDELDFHIREIQDIVATDFDSLVPESEVS